MRLLRKQEAKDQINEIHRYNRAYMMYLRDKEDKIQVFNIRKHSQE